MKTLSIVVPTKGCVNNCSFCVSKMHDNRTNDLSLHGDSQLKIRKRIEYALLNGVDTLILTGTGEPLQNRGYISQLNTILRDMGNPIPNIELQTTGVLLGSPMNELSGINLIKEFGVNTVSLSISAPVSMANWKIVGMPMKVRVSFWEVARMLKHEGFNVRFSFNMTNEFDISPDKLFQLISGVADQVVFRELYYDKQKDTPESEWVQENRLSDDKFRKFNEYVLANGNFLYKLSYGKSVYSVNGISTVVDDDCMAKEVENIRYFIIREDGKLYCRWDDDGSLIF